MKIIEKIKELEDLVTICDKLRAESRSIVFTNGCFDIVHSGHAKYLEEAASLGDVLIVGLNSDASVKRLKGDSRPINNQDDRAVVLAAMASVSYVVIFTQDTPYELIKALSPDILVKGGDWKEEQIVGSDLVLARGGSVKSLSFVPGRSSTAIINSIMQESK